MLFAFYFLDYSIRLNISQKVCHRYSQKVPVRGETVHRGIGSPRSKMPILGYGTKRIIFDSIQFILVCEQRL
jgi:hypothetical protein